VTDQTNLKIPFDSPEISIQHYLQFPLRTSIVPAVKEISCIEIHKAGAHIGLDFKLHFSAAASG
jgi:hypothetical protein